MITTDNYDDEDKNKIFYRSMSGLSFSDLGACSLEGQGHNSYNSNDGDDDGGCDHGCDHDNDQNWTTTYICYGKCV